MTFRIIIMLTALAGFIESSFSQLLNRELMQLEKEIYFASSDSARTLFAMKKMDVYFAHDILNGEAVKEAMRVDYSFLGDRLLQKRFLWNAFLLCHLNGNDEKALDYFIAYEKEFSLISAEEEIMGLMAYSGHDSIKAKNLVSQLVLRDSSLRCLSCLQEVNNYKRKGKNIFMVSSAVVPGSGSMINGNLRKGFTSLVLCSGTGAGTYLLIKSNLYLNAVLLGGVFFLKFYGGNILLTRKLFIEKQEKKRERMAGACKKNFKDALEKYPVSFR